MSSKRSRLDLGGTHGLSQDACAQMGLQGRWRHEIDSSAKNFSKPLLQPDELDQPDGSRKVDQ